MTTLTKTLIAAVFVLAMGTFFQLHRINGQSEALRGQIRKIEEQENSNRQLREERDRNLAEISKCQNAIDAEQQLVKKTTGDNALNTWVGRVDLLKARLHAAPEMGIPEMQFLKTNDWFSVTLDNPLDTDAKIRDALSKLRAIAKTKPQVGPNIMTALHEFSKSHNQPPADATALRPYLNPPLSDEILERYRPVPEVPGQNDATVAITRDGSRMTGSGRFVLEEKSPVDEDYDTWIAFTEKGGSTFGRVSQLGKAVDQAMQAFNRANNGQEASTPSQLLPFLPPTIDPIRLKEFWEIGHH